MKFRIWTILWVFALMASAWATFGFVGILFATLITILHGISQYKRKRGQPGITVVELLVASVIFEQYSLSRACIRITTTAYTNASGANTD